MSRMNELSIAIDELRNAAAALNSVADSLTQLFSSEEPAKEEPAPKPITKEEVRAELAAKSAAGYGVQVRALLKRYGAAQLSAVNPDDYADLLLEAQAIGTEVGADLPPKLFSRHCAALRNTVPRYSRHGSSTCGDAWYNPERSCGRPDKPC